MSVTNLVQAGLCDPEELKAFLRGAIASGDLTSEQCASAQKDLDRLEASYPPPKESDGP